VQILHQGVPVLVDRLGTSNAIAKNRGCIQR
jgi:hypothetical protein